MRNDRSPTIRGGKPGFSLTELLVFVALLLLVAAVAVPRLTHSQLASNEASAMQSLREVHQAESVYTSRHPDKGFSKSLADLADLGSASQNFDPNLAAGHKGGYTFTYVPGEQANGAIRTYTITAVPDKVGDTGQRRFYSDESGEVRYNASGPADTASPVIQ